MPTEQQERRKRLAELPELVSGLSNRATSERERCTKEIRQLLSGINAPIQPVIDAGVIPKLVSFPLVEEQSSPALQVEAAWALCNILFGQETHVQAVVDGGAVPPLISLLASGNADLEEHAMIAVGNMSSTSVAFRELLLAKGALQPLLDLASKENQTVDVLENASFALCNLFSKEPTPSLEDYVRPALPTLAILLLRQQEDTYKSTEVLHNAVQTYHHILQGQHGNQVMHAIVTTNSSSSVISKLVQCMNHPHNARIQLVATECVAEIAATVHRDALFPSRHLIEFLVYKLASHHGDTRHQALQIVADLCLSRHMPTALVTSNINNNMPQLLLQMIHNDQEERRNQVHAATAFANLTWTATPQQLTQIGYRGSDKERIQRLSTKPIKQESNAASAATTTTAATNVSTGSQRVTTTANTGLGRNTNPTTAARHPKKPKPKKAPRQSKWQRRKGGRLTRA